MDINRDWNVFVGSMTGIVKGITVTDKGFKRVKNLLKVEHVNNKNEVTSLSWGNKEETEILIGYKDQTVKIYNTDTKSFTFDSKLNCGDGPIKGLSKYQGNLLTAVESGEIRQWDVVTKIKSEDKIHAGKFVERMCHSADNVHCIATGGKENELKLWDLENSVVTFTAKNVRPDELQLRVPVWISDITFLPASSKVAISSRHGFVRLYDPNSSFRRPVSNVHIPDQALTCISAASRDGHVLVGSGTGHMFLVDLRNKGILLNHYKGFVGGIRHIACSKNGPYVVSVGLDRHMRIHELNSKELLFKEYLQSRLTSVLLRSDFTVAKSEDDKDIDDKDILLTIKENNSSITEEVAESFIKSEKVDTECKPKRLKRIKSELGGHDDNSIENDGTSDISTTVSSKEKPFSKKLRKLQKPKEKNRITYKIV